MAVNLFLSSVVWWVTGKKTGPLIYQSTGRLSKSLLLTRNLYLYFSQSVVWKKREYAIEEKREYAIEENREYAIEENKWEKKIREICHKT